MTRTAGCGKVAAARLKIVAPWPCSPPRKRFGHFLSYNVFLCSRYQYNKWNGFTFFPAIFLSVLHPTPKYWGPYIKVLFFQFQKSQLLKKKENVSAWPLSPCRDGYVPGPTHPWNICISMWHRPRLLISACIHPPCYWFLLCLVPRKCIFWLR